MQKILLIIILGVYSPLISLCQTQDSIFLDHYWRKTTKDNAEYFRIIEKSAIDKSHIISDYFIDGKIQMRGSYYSKSLKKRDGKFTWYDKAGNKTRQCLYKKDRLTGASTRWFKNQQIDETGSYEKGRRVGLWRFYFENGQQSAEITFKKGKIESESYWNEDGSEMMFYSQAFSRPEYPGGTKSFWIDFKKIAKPKYVLCSDGRSSDVQMSFIIDIKGNITDIQIKNTPHPVLEAEAIRVINLMNKKWKPAVYFNRILPKIHRINIRFYR